MVGVIRFDRDAALDAAAALFWRKGYDCASIQDLEAATGLGRGSLYNAFGDKEALFLAALERYAETVSAPLLRHLEAADIGAGVNALLAELVGRIERTETPPGCLVTNTCVAAAGAPAAERFAAARLRAMERALESAFEKARANGRLAADADPRALARFYTAVAQSLNLMHKALDDRETMADVARTALSALPLVGAPPQPIR
ncbi:helix-turn-helix transcriptional regulator [Pikeienuella piscinae]|uniref:Helix-turn-helix transcriptional regulator n=1 Tax=Pikeienuella piscinae TaxID=2748098 RepID=A0A7L5BXG1_9RHOB|nr:TetR/AcrR family transcriptional regulator [Pikeienuella piscinae]QIE54936.1 helix-turn-helix transcriptional regulator [Pikeienuella piscinae]